MSTTTSNIGLFKYDLQTDGQQSFNITRSMNNNWDIIDLEIGNAKIAISNLENIEPVVINSAQGYVSLENKNVYYIILSGNVQFVLPSNDIMNPQKFGQILVMLWAPYQYAVDVGTSNFFVGVNGDIQPIEFTYKYTLYYEWDTMSQRWVCGIIKQV